MKTEFIEKLKMYAARECWYDDAGWSTGETIPDDFAGGNIDDAYYGGERDGESGMARMVLKELGIEAKSEV